MTDGLLHCLTYLSEHYGRAKSEHSLTAGMAYDGTYFGPELFVQAAERIGLKAKVTKRENLGDIARAVLPVVLILRDGQVCVLLSRKEGVAHIYLPETDSKKDIPLDDLSVDYAGYAIFVHPQSEFSGQGDDMPAGASAASNHGHWFWSLVEDNRKTYTMALLSALFINFFGLVSPLFIMNVYDRVIPNNAIETGWALGIGALVIFVFDFIMRSLRAYLIDIASRRVDVIGGRRIYDHVLDMKLAHRPKSSGAFANMLRDFDSVRDFFTSATITGLVDLPFTLFFLFVIFQIGGALALYLVLLIGFIVLVGFMLQKPLKEVVRKSTQSSEAKHGLLVETIHGLETIKSIGADGRFRKRYSDYLAENAAYGQKSRFISGLGVNIATYIQQIASIILVLAGMYMVKDGDLTMGGLIACVILSGRAIAPIGQIANLMTRYHQAGGALKTLDNLLSKPTDRDHEKQYLHRPDLKGKITFDNVSFAYPSVDRAVLEKISFSINPGERVGIIGRVGSGKSTISRLMMGLYEPAGGTILLDDTDARQIDPADARRAVAYVAQDVVLFQGTIRENIMMGKPQATDEEILRAAQITGVHDFVSRHPMGYDAPVGEQGNALSGGQKQALALARAALMNPAVLLCDEPTNAMDVQAEELFKRYVSEFIKGKTFVMITHKFGLLDMVDRLILIDGGRVLADGPRDVVLKALSEGKIGVKA